MPIGTQDFEYVLDNEFFKNIEGEDVQKGKVKVKLTVKRTAASFELDFDLEGVIQIPCDRCLDDMDHEVKTQETLYVKFGSEYSEESDNVVVIPESDGELNIAWFLYEFIALTIPLKHVHQAGKCNKSMSAKLRKHAARSMDDSDESEDAAKKAASSEKIAEIDTKIAIFQKNYDTNLARAAIYKESLPTLQADIDAAQSECDKAHNRTRDLEAELNKIPHTDYETRWQLELAIMDAQEQESRCEDKLEHCRMRLESQKSLIYFLESEVEFNKTHLDGETAKRDTLLDNLKKAQTAYDDARKAYEEAKAAADKATSPEITQPTETTPPSGSTQPAETTQPASSPATGKDAAPSSAKQANSSNGKQATTTADKLANTGDTTPSAIALAGIAVAGLGITATATRRLKNSK